MSAPETRGAEREEEEMGHRGEAERAAQEGGRGQVPRMNGSGQVVIRFRTSGRPALMPSHAVADHQAAPETVIRFGKAETPKRYEDV